MKKSITIADEPGYTGFCDKEGVKIHLGDTLQFTSWQGAVWTGIVSFEDGTFTISILGAKQVKNPDDWTSSHDWVDSGWWSTHVGYGEYGTWNCVRRSLPDIAGNFSTYEEFKETKDKCVARYEGWAHDYLERPLPCLVVAKGEAVKEEPAKDERIIKVEIYTHSSTEDSSINFEEGDLMITHVGSGERVTRCDLYAILESLEDIDTRLLSPECWYSFTLTREKHTEEDRYNRDWFQVDSMEVIPEPPGESEPITDDDELPF